MNTSVGPSVPAEEPRRLQFYGPVSRKEKVATSVRLNDIVTHETPGKEKVARLVAALHAGDKFDPVEIDAVWREHWTQGPAGMESTGWGYGLLDGHHRLEALRQVNGEGHMVEAFYSAAIEPSVPRLEKTQDSQHCRLRE